MRELCLGLTFSALGEVPEKLPQTHWPGVDPAHLCIPFLVGWHPAQGWEGTLTLWSPWPGERWLQLCLRCGRWTWGYSLPWQVAGMCACANEHFLLDHHNTIPFLGWDVVESHSCLRLRHLCFIVNLTSLQTRDLEKNTFPGNYPCAIDFYFLWGHFLPTPSSFSQTPNPCLGIIGLNWIISPIDKLLSVYLLLLLFCLLHFNSVCTMLIVSVV